MTSWEELLTERGSSYGKKRSNGGVLGIDGNFTLLSGFNKKNIHVSFYNWITWLNGGKELDISFVQIVIIPRSEW